MRRMVRTTAVTALLSASSCLAFSPLAVPTSSTTAATTTTMHGLERRRPLYASSDPNQWLNHQLPILDAERSTSTLLPQREKLQRKPINPTPALVSAWNKSGILSNSKKPAAFMLGLTLMLATIFSASNPALAAMSGGRVGGGGYGRSSYSRPAPTRTYSGGGSYGYTPRTNIYVNPGPRIVAPFGPPIIAPFAPVVPFSPFGFGAGVAVARGPSFFDILFFGAVAMVIANTVRGFGQSTMDQWSDTDSDYATMATPLGRGTTVAKISVALQVPNRDDPQSILNVLPRLSQSAQTERRAGLQNLTSQIALELLRRKSQIVSASTSSQHFRDRTKAEQAFGEQSIRERSKFEKESFSRFRGADWSTSTRRMVGSDADGKATMAVVTLLIEIDGDATKLPNISSINSVEEALRKIASDSRVGECLQSAEILWTPEDRSEILTEREVVADYPELRSV
uniref:Uncharacterized protein n=1 Tax=Amphora coffeiformis TaxID=265554 RepID=A0A7S3L727_9STRA|mmetsp:Transcript_15210/g.28871  ORF Transcript_15210/g.28871 Transcript_15210/m.28871 type:complete len:454 (-) Transcript_15210:144-1505(-)